MTRFNSKRQEPTQYMEKRSGGASEADAQTAA